MPVEPSTDADGAVAPGSFARPFAGPMVEVARWSAGTSIGLLLAAAVLLGWRRLAGALHDPLELPALLVAGSLIAALAAGVRIAWSRLPPADRTVRRDRLLAVLSTVAVLILGMALSLPGTDHQGLLVFWALLAAGEVWAWRPAAWRRSRRMPPARAAGFIPARVDPPQAPSPHPAPTDVPPSTVLQQLTRSRAANGGEQIAGWLRMPFSAGQRTASVHVAFCPPFPRIPELAVQQLEGPTARIKTAQLLPHGARLDLKLSAVAEESDSVLLKFSARSKDTG